MSWFKKLFSFFWDRSLLFFLIIGGANTVLSMAGSWVLNHILGWHLFFAMATMFALCSIPSFYFNRKYSFKSKAPLGQSILRFTVIVTVCFLLSYGINQIAMPWMHSNWFPGMPDGWYSLLRIVGVQVVFTLLNYLGQRLWAFKE